MSRAGRLWTGVTLLAVLFINYAVIGVPLYRKQSSIESRYKAAMIKQLKPGGFFKSGDDEYLVDIYRRERASVAGSIRLMNTVSLSALIIIASWTVFGLLMRKAK